MDRNNRPFSATRWVAAAALAASVLTLRGDALAACWYDPNVTAAARSTAQRFPRAARRMPEVVVCDDGDFGPMIGGDFTGRPGGSGLIRVPRWQLGPRGSLHATLAHELAHAEAHAQGLVEPFGGHGAGFMAALLVAGWEQEAERVARTIAGADRALAAARRLLNEQPVAAAPPARHRPVQVVCETVARHYDFMLPNGSLARRTVCELVCRVAPS